MHRYIFFLLGAAWWLGLPPTGWSQDAQLAAKINAAIDKGIVYLKKMSEGDNAGAKRPGAAALRGWALLEAGVPSKDKAIQNLADYVRKEVPEMTQTYDVSLAVIFLDRLGDQGDRPLIESLAVRLLAGQARGNGGWTYHTANLILPEKERLTKVIQDMKNLRAQGQTIQLKPRPLQEFQQELIRQFKNLEAPATDSGDFLGDNSNTQFAMIAMWVAKRHGFPVKNCLELVERRFRRSQTEKGTWGYEPPANLPAEDDNHYTYPGMTCAGLLGIALGQGVQKTPKDLSKDIQVLRGLEAMAKPMGTDYKPPDSARADNLHYYLFSMERVCVIYNLKKIGDHDWYLWGARKLVENQTDDGGFQGHFSQEGADSCFALLFLKRANVAEDLTRFLNVNPIRKGSGGLLDIPQPKKEEKRDKATPKQSRREMPREPLAGNLSQRWLLAARPALTARGY